MNCHASYSFLLVGTTTSLVVSPCPGYSHRNSGSHVFLLVGSNPAVVTIVDAVPALVVRTGVVAEMMS